jgi:hypothetical protein
MNTGSSERAREGIKDMKKTLTTVRCVPRFGYDFAEVRTVDVELPDDEENTLRESLNRWFALHGIADAIYDVDVDASGYFAIINDEAFCSNWGEPLL